MNRHTLLLIILTAGVYFHTNAQTRNPADFKGPISLSMVQTTNAQVGISGDGGLLIQTEGTDPRIQVNAPSGAWDLRNKTFITMNVSNLGETEIRLSCTLGDHSWNQGLLILNPGEQGKLNVIIKGVPLPEDHPLARNFIRMRGLPGGYVWHWVPFDPAHVEKISFTLIEPEGPAAFLVHSLEAGGNLNQFSDEVLKRDYFPFVDRFGQYIPGDWPGKIREQGDMVRESDREAAELTSLPGPADWDAYGGWLDGPQLDATGHFRVEKWKGKWWLVDPDGHLFWSHGPDCVRFTNGQTSLVDRKHYFSDLPEKDSPLAQFYNRNSSGEETYNFTAANLYSKYGENWKKKGIEVVHKRLRSWGMNTIANWSDPDIYQIGETPYTVNISFGWPQLGGILKFPDVFHADYRSGLEKALREASETWQNPYCIGYFIDNELHGWEGMGETVFRSPASEAAKIEFVNGLRKKYGNIKQLNAAWNTGYRSWNELFKTTEVPDNESCRDDIREFEVRLVDTYYSISRETVRSLAPDKLYLGSRLDFHSYPADNQREWVVEIAARHCDIISFNRYSFNARNLLLPEGMDKPVIIGEFHFGALDRGMLHTGLRSVQDQEQRGRAYYHYIRGALENPYLVGAHWFQYGEQSVTGRFDGENYQIGLLDVCDTPYSETLQKSREIGYQMYKVRSGAQSTLDQ